MRPKLSVYSRYFTYIKPITKLPIVRTYGSTIFTIIVITIFVFFAIKPTIETILVLQKKVADSDRLLGQLEKKAENLSLGKRNFENLDPSVKSKIQAAIPDSLEVKSIIQTLEASARIHEASISALQFQPQTLQVKEENKLGVLQEVGFTFNVEGDYTKLSGILTDLSSTSRLISISSVSINRVSEGSGIIMSISGKAWYYK